MARTDNLTNYLTDVATAIKTKKGDDTPINISEFDTEITNLPSGGDNNFVDIQISGNNYDNIGQWHKTINEIPPITIKSNKYAYIFYYFKGTKINAKLEITDKTNGSYMYYGCENLIDVPNYDYSQITNADRMFYDCKNLNKINIDFSNAKSINNMFYNCINLTELANYDFSNATNTFGVFSNCGIKNYPIVDFSSSANCQNLFASSKAEVIQEIKLNSCKDINMMFYEAINLKSVTLTNTGNVTNASKLFNIYMTLIK